MLGGIGGRNGGNVGEEVTGGFSECEAGKEVERSEKAGPLLS